VHSAGGDESRGVDAAARRGDGTARGGGIFWGVLHLPTEGHRGRSGLPGIHATQVCGLALFQVKTLLWILSWLLFQIWKSQG
jgi:hypothetical protein